MLPPDGAWVTEARLVLTVQAAPLHRSHVSETPGEGGVAESVEEITVGGDVVCDGARDIDDIYGTAPEGHIKCKYQTLGKSLTFETRWFREYNSLYINI